ncbi:MAG TPA: trehalose corynomycolyl transferase [Candidatus Corynebacterium avicola]|uniref:Trehalose corynomycolyl transferase n=1 Tax=Candidatus Corynebacterium avicola TaxID=2838527 RepID=A0A9D1ULA2_9CORY|nr:trehalose corynomycolyl transferase [Candidatus Corynebacterium avicola]
MFPSSRRPRSNMRIVATAATAALALTSFAAVPSAVAQDDDTDAANIIDDATGQEAPDIADVPSDTRGVTAPENSPLAFMDPGPSPERETMRVTEQNLPNLPEGVSVEKVEWINDRWAKLYINSAAMPEAPVQVQVHLARDWYSDPEKTFPSVWQLGPLYSDENESAWSYATDAVRYYADKNVNLILPVGGGGSFFTDWQQADGGKNFQWETFLTKELPPILEQGWRTNDRRAVNGLSMGATGATILAGRNAEMFDFVASFSGYLDTTSPGMPYAFGQIAGQAGFDATKMWGPYYSADWFAHDPKLLVRNFKNAGTRVYVAAGNGTAGNWDEDNNIPGSPDNIQGGAMEAASRVTSQTFVNSAKLAGVDVISKFRPNGTHIWPYWEYEMQQSWPYMAESLGLSEDDSSVECEAEGKFEEAVERYRTNHNNWDLGDCISEVYEIKDEDDEVIGTAQDFRGGVLYLQGGELDDPEAGEDEAIATWGRTSAKYREEGGPNSWLGWPKEPDSWGRDGGAWARFENGFIYWHSVQGDAGPVTMKMDVYEAYEKKNFEYGAWGYPISEEEDIRIDGETGQVQKFENGIAVRDPDGDVHMLHGAIAERFTDLGTADRNRLGFPAGDHSSTSVPGYFTDFDNGVIYWSQDHGTALIYHGPIFDRYRELGYEGGRLGFLVEDEVINADGSRSAVFENGTLRADKDGKVTEEDTGVDKKYDSLTEEQQEELGEVLYEGGSHTSPDGTKGLYRAFEGGVIYWSAKHGGTVIFDSKVLDLYAEADHERGRYGFLTEDETVNADGSREAVFERGTITMDADRNVTGSLEESE